MAGVVQRHMLLALGLFAADLGPSLATDCPDYWTVFQGSCYWFGSGNPLKFSEAENFCRQIGGHLVHVDNANENTFLKNALRTRQNGDTWIGFTDEFSEGIWLWYDTRIAQHFTDWYPTEPSNANHNENCASFRAWGDYKWNDVPCSWSIEPLCEIRKGETVVVG